MNGNICELYFKFCIVNKKLKIKDRGRFLFLRTTAGAPSFLFPYANI